MSDAGQAADEELTGPDGRSPAVTLPLDALRFSESPRTESVDTAHGQKLARIAGLLPITFFVEPDLGSWPPGPV